MSRNYMIEMIKVLCTKCGKELWCLIRSQEELNTLLCERCLTPDIQQIEVKEEPQSSKSKTKRKSKRKGEKPRK